jgi:hypothetical protein
MIQTKKSVADRIVLRLQNAFPNADFKIFEKEIFRVVDDKVNARARENFMNNWKLGSQNTDESFITTWDGENAIAVVDVEEDQSYIELPATPVALYENQGVVEVWPMNFEFGAVRIRRHEHIRRSKNLMSGNMQQELGGYRNGSRFVFDQVDVGKNFAATFGVRLVIKDSTAVGLYDPYPVAADILDLVIEDVYQYFLERKIVPTDTVRDRNDKENG